MDEHHDWIDRARLKSDSIDERLNAHESPAGPVESSRYDVQTLLGEGAAGRVWRAYDRTLHRFVALKRLRLTDPASRERFLREARNQARVKHPNICNVFDIGELDGEPFIAMHCVEGRTLSAAAAEMTLREKVELMRRVAEAVHAAHNSGLVHRDLKPGNILVEKNENAWVPYITDFGLAREEDNPDRTKTGMIIGTPAYMAPEQALGNVREIDPRTDIYGLGATFYQLLTGQPPFTGTSLEIVMKTSQEEPKSLRKIDRMIPEDIETIVLKCLQKPPERRYYSAQALADDLKRYLQGEPILARRSSWANRLVHRARRHRNVTAILLIAFVAILLSASISFYNWRTASKRAELAQQFGREVAEIEGFLRYSFSLPIHDIRKERKAALEKVKKIQEKMEDFGASAKGPGNFAMGKVYLALHDYPAARKYLEAAWNAGHQTSETAYALGNVFGALYSQELESLQQISNEQTRRVRQQVAEKDFRDPALRYLQAVETKAGVTPEYLAALIAFYSGDPDRAAKVNSAVSKKDPWFYESIKLQGDLEVSQGIQKQQTGEYKDAIASYNRAGESYRKASEIARSDASIYDADCRRLIQALSALDQQGTLTIDAFSQAIEACDRTLQVDPEHASAFTRKSAIYSYWAVNQRLNKGDPAPFYEKAIEMAKKAIRIKPDFAEAWNDLGNGYIHLVYAYWDSGVERGPTIQLALDAFQRAIQLKPDDESYCYLGDAYSDQAVDLSEKGRNPSSAFNASIAAYENAIRFNANISANHANLGMVLIRKGMYQLHHGEDPSGALQAAIERYRDALKLNPKHPWSHNNLAVARLTLAEFEMARSGNPIPHFNDAALKLQDAMKLNPKAGLPHIVSARTWIARADYLRRAGQSPESAIAQGREALNKYMEISGRALGSDKDLAALELVAAEWAMQNNNSPQLFLSSAETNLRDALKRNPKDAETFRRYAKYSLISATNLAALNRNAIPEIDRGIEHTTAAIKIDSQWGETYAIRAELLHSKAKLNRDEQIKKQLNTEAHQTLTKALKLNRNLNTKYADLLRDLQ